MALSALPCKGQLGKCPYLFQCRKGLCFEENWPSLNLASEEDTIGGKFNQL